MFFGSIESNFLFYGPVEHVSSGLIDTMIIIGTIMIGILGFQDALTVKQGVGLVFAVLAVGLMV